MSAGRRSQSRASAPPLRDKCENGKKIEGLLRQKEGKGRVVEQKTYSRTTNETKLMELQDKAFNHINEEVSMHFAIKHRRWQRKIRWRYTKGRNGRESEESV